MKQGDFRRLVDAALDGDISEADAIRLEAELSEDPQRRREYLDRVALDAALMAHAASDRDQQPASLRSVHPNQATRTFSSRDTQRWLTVIAAALVAMIASWFLWERVGGQEDGNLRRNDERVSSASQPEAARNSRARQSVGEKDGVEQQASGYAIIAGQADAKWQDGMRRSTGDLLTVGTLQLSAGLVHLEFFSGVSTVVEGPARFSIESAMEMTVQSGKLRAHVPEPARGFRVTTPDGVITDLGTDFAVDLQSGQSELHVLTGEVELQQQTQGPARYTAGQAIDLAVANRTSNPSGDGSSKVRIADGSRFVGHLELNQRLEAKRKSRREQWLQWGEQQLADSRLVVAYQVGRGESSRRQLPNLASGTQSSATGQTAVPSKASEGAVVAAVRTADRWKHRDGALDFSPTGSRIRMNVPSELSAISLLCWVKINSLDRWYNSLFLTDGHEQGEPHWQIMDDGRLFFSVKKRDTWDPSKGERDKHIFYSPKFWRPSMSGQWQMLATTYDVERKQVTHFLNGEALSRERIPDSYAVSKIRIGNASVGNWGLPERNEPRFAVRNLNGSIDEFAIYNAVLSDDEIREMYDRGKP